MKRVTIIHGWGMNPGSVWIPWLKKELEAKGTYVETPEMPNTDAPEIEQWLKELAKHIDEEDDNYLVGHSIGCQTILRYLENKPDNIKVKGVLLVAGWLTLTGTASPEEEAIAKPWVETPVDLGKVKTKSKFISIFSDDDPYVPEENWKKFEELGEVIIEDKKGHIEGPLASIIQSIEKLMTTKE